MKERKEINHQNNLKQPSQEALYQALHFIYTQAYPRILREEQIRDDVDQK
ncbi:hypothetical protein [Geomicrobium sediminis]|uniref:Uncharacterized protein n=1 Tax=Geomicrobium sediminis TaxID=1347788 RepID=A0ABS2P6V6_9BACL|nr:hypothetical protein [Geomicrobium sediminis]MBM7631132.1 hypothetical protein [Geomicrobium sediminis]